MKFAKVILDIQSNKFSNAFTYVICNEETSDDSLKKLHEILSDQVVFKEKGKYEIQVGSCVVVPFGKQFKLAFVIEVFEKSQTDAVINYGKLKPVLFAVTDNLFNSDCVAFANFISKKYLSSMATSLRLFIPAGSSPKLKHNSDVWEVDVHKFRNAKENFIEKYCSNNFNNSTNWESFVLTEGQNNSLNEICESINNNTNDVFVLDGVTGSGKTEVYLRAIQNVLDKGKNAVVLVPEISLTPQTVSRFYNRFGNLIAVIHSKITATERFNQYEKIRKGQARLVIGARSALFSPLQNIGIIVIDEEHENSYKQDKNPRYRTRDCAAWLAKQNNAPLVLGTATPSLESIYNCQILDNWHHLKLLERTNNKPMPKIEVVDMGLEFKSGSKNLFSKKLAKSICDELSANHKVILLHNRRGFSNYMFCRGCGYTPKCPNCSTTLTYHQRLLVDGAYKQMLLCHHCGHLEHVPIRCPECDSPYIAKYGAGTQSVEEQLEALISDSEIENARIIRMDADTTKDRMGHQKCLEEFGKPGPAVLLGTQMIAKGLDFDDVTLVGVVLIDTALSLPDFRSSENTFDLILQVAGRSGRANLEGKVILQTYNPDNESIVRASNYDHDGFINLELQKRSMLSYPPYVSLGNIIISGSDKVLVEEKSNLIYEKLIDFKEKNNLNDIEIMPACACVLERIRGMYRYHILCKCSLDRDISKFISQALKDESNTSKIKINIDIDPQNLF